MFIKWFGALGLHDSRIIIVIYIKLQKICQRTEASRSMTYISHVMYVLENRLAILKSVISYGLQ